MKKIYFLIGITLLNITSYASERFVVGTGLQRKCITDTKTNLMLVKTPTAVKYTWDDANKYVKSLNLCGFNDWRLPTKEEHIKLQNEVGYYSAFAWFNTHGFENIQTDFYWASESYIKDSEDAWGIYMYSSKVYPEPKSNLNYVWPVRKI